MDDLIVDIPKAKDVFSLMKKRCQLKGALEGAKAKFIPAGTFAGAKAGYDFKMGANGMGYYLQGGSFHGGLKNSDSNSNSNPKAPVSAKPNPFGSARPVSTGTKATSSIFGDAKPVDIDAKLAGKNLTTTVKEVKKKSNPFGAAKPVDIKVPPAQDAKERSSIDNVTGVPSPPGVLERKIDDTLSVSDKVRFITVPSTSLTSLFKRRKLLSKRVLAIHKDDKLYKNSGVKRVGCTRIVSEKCKRCIII